MYGSQHQYMELSLNISKVVVEGNLLFMSKRNIKKRVYDDEFVLMELEDQPHVKKRRHPSKKSNYQSDDDSFQYGDPKKQKKQPKLDKKKLKAQQRASAAPTLPPDNQADAAQKKKLPTRQQVRVIEQANTEYVVRFVQPRKPKIEKERKIFNPDEHLRHLELRDEYQNRLADLHNQYGRSVLKLQEPKTIVTGWEHLMKHVEAAGKQRMKDFQEKVRLAKKVARYAQMAYGKIESVQQQKQKQEERKVRRTASAVWKLVQKDYWRNIARVTKYLDNEQRKRDQKQVQSKRLEQLVQKQLQVSTKISRMLQGIQEVKLSGLEVSNVVFPPIIINLNCNPISYGGLQQDKIIRQPLLIKHPLRQYQLLGMHWIYTLHNRKMNGILADQMGLGKTIQTIAFLAHLALSKGVWGPHLVIVPTSIIINWEIQFKRWCPAFKIMTYFGSPKQRKVKRKGWSKLNSFHVCITSYKIVVTDQAIFKRKKWYYMVLDQAQHIKNYKSQRWQTLLNFNARYRLLLTGTPLQNDISELWSLLHFLMPALFTSFQDFNEWFNIPFQQALQKNFPVSQQILRKLHTVLRPFFLRRLKKDVQKQLPSKTELIIRCPLSRRQKYLYDQFISHESKKNPEIMGMMNILMQLKKVCNHPDLFLPRVQDTPLNWPLISFVVAAHMLVNMNQTPQLYSNVAVSISFEELAEELISQFQKVRCNKFSFEYYSNFYRTRMQCMRVNYLRSCKKNFNIQQVYPETLLRAIQAPPIELPNIQIHTIESRLKSLQTVLDYFLFCVPKVTARTPRLVLSKFSIKQYIDDKKLDVLCPQLREAAAVFWRVESQLRLHFPQKNILLYDSGKLVKMVGLLKRIKQDGQKALIFTQMTKMLDIFQKVMNMYQFNYVRLDGGTRTQVRQQLVERFNNDPRVLVFISSTRSGGIGLNLTGASNVIFYDTDWNPAMDKQAQDRCHRIGQTRNVTIYRLISEYTIQENILIKSYQKRRLDQLVTEDGMFNTQYFQKVNIRDMLQGVIGRGEAIQGDLAQVQDNQDRQMLARAQLQGRQNAKDFAHEQTIEVQMFPALFQYGLRMTKHTGLETFEQSEVQVDEQEEDQEQKQQISGNQQEQHQIIVQESERSEGSKQKVVQKTQAKAQSQEEDPASNRVTDFERYSGIITYQKHYNYIKKNFYES